MARATSAPVRPLWPGTWAHCWKVPVTRFCAIIPRIMNGTVRMMYRSMVPTLCPMADPGSPTTSVEAFVERFAGAWAAPDPDRFAQLMHPQGCLEQPLAPTLVGRDQVRDASVQLQRLLPDLRGDLVDFDGDE